MWGVFVHSKLNVNIENSAYSTIFFIRGKLNGCCTLSCFHFIASVKVSVTLLVVSNNGHLFWGHVLLAFSLLPFQTPSVCTRSWWRTAAAAADACWRELCNSWSHLEVSRDSVVAVDKLAADHLGDIKGRNELCWQAARSLSDSADLESEELWTALIFISTAANLRLYW